MIVKLKKLKEKKCVIKRELMLENYKDYLFNGEAILKSQQRFKSNHHKVYTEEVHKIALSTNDDKRLQTFKRVKVYENEMVLVREVFLKKYVDCPFYGDIVLKR